MTSAGIRAFGGFPAYLRKFSFFFFLVFFHFFSCWIKAKRNIEILSVFLSHSNGSVNFIFLSSKFLQNPAIEEIAKEEEEKGRHDERGLPSRQYSNYRLYEIITALFANGNSLNCCKYRGRMARMCDPRC